MIYDRELPKAQQELEPRIRALLPAHAPVKFVLSMGQDVKADHLALGFRAGPSLDVSNLLHELAHLIEIDDGRAAVHGWGLKYAQVEILGRLYDQPETYQGALRECRTIAWSRRLGEAIGYDLKINEFIRSLRFLTDFMMVPHRKDGTLADWDKDRFRFLRRNVTQYLKTYTVEAAKTELGRKCEVLQDTFRRRAA